MQRKLIRKSKWKYNIASFIPLGCFGALLALSVITLNPDNQSYTYATDDVFAIMPLADSTVTLSIGNSKISTSTTGEDIAYVSNDITVTAGPIDNYTLQISGNPTLDGPSNITAIATESTTIADDTWGYSWNNSGKYQGITENLATLETGSGDSNYNVNFTKTLTFAAKFSDKAEAGHYTTDVNLLLTVTPKTLIYYEVNLNVNGGNQDFSPKTIRSFGTYDSSYTITLPDNQPTKAGYAFIGWSTSSTGNVEYQPGDTVTLQASAPSITIYAQWKQMFNGITTMQQMTPAICAAASTGDITTLTDNRDYLSGIDKTYTIRKHEDGKCWMTQNLRIVGTTINSTGSNVSASYDIPNTTDLSTWTDTTISANYAYNNPDTDAGAYYSWRAAAAGNTTYNSYDICPKNWRLPTLDEFSTFLTSENITDTEAGSAKIQTSPYNFILSGYIYSQWGGGSLDDHGEAGRWWTSTTAGEGAGSLNITQQNVAINRNSGVGMMAMRRLGYSIRCIAQ